MRKLILLLFTGLILSFQSDSENPNPIYNSFNEPINFAAITADHIAQATISVQNETNESMDQIIQIADDEKTFENTFLAIDDLSANLSDVYATIYLLSSTHSDSAKVVPE